MAGSSRGRGTPRAAARSGTRPAQPAAKGSARAKRSAAQKQSASKRPASKSAPASKRSAPKRAPSSKRPAAKRAPASKRTARTTADGRLRRAATGDRPYVVALLVLVILLGGMAAGPLKSFTAAADRVDALAASRGELRDEVDRLEERKSDLQDPEEIELLARQELNLVKPGEVPFIVVTPEPDFERTEPGKGDHGSGGDVSLWRRLVDAFSGLFE